MLRVSRGHNEPSFAQDACEQWFDTSKIKPGDGCLSQCSILETSMKTFNCPMACANFCKNSIPEKLTFNLSQLYPSLTQAERALAAENPGLASEAYYLSWRAETLCNSLCVVSRWNDESDACRHFVWAGLLLEKHTENDVRKVLDAHEQDDNQLEAERGMDLANNQKGLFSARRLIETKKFSPESLLESFEHELAKKGIVVLEPKKGLSK